MKTISLKCPNCGQNLTANEDRAFCFCQYCGTKVLIQNENEHIIRHVDETRLKKLEMKQQKLEMERQRIEAEKQIRLKELEMLERERIAAEEKRKKQIIIGLLVGLIGAIVIIIGAIADNGLSIWGINIILFDVIFFGYKSLNGKPDTNSQLNTTPPTVTMIKLPEEIVDEDYADMDYESVEEEFRDAGFTNVNCVPLEDLSPGMFGRIPRTNEKVSEITVDGIDIDDIDRKRVRQDAEIMIHYHSLEEN